MKTPAKVLVFLVILIAVLVIVYAASYRSTTAPEGNPVSLSDEQSENGDSEVEDLPFLMDLPEDWEHIQLQGIDSRVGELRNGSVTITYDYGWYGGFPIDPANPEYASYRVEVLEIDNHIVRLGYPEDGSGAVAAYIQDEKAATSSKPLNSVALYADTVPLERLDEIIGLMQSARLN